MNRIVPVPDPNDPDLLYVSHGRGGNPLHEVDVVYRDRTEHFEGEQAWHGGIEWRLRATVRRAAKRRQRRKP